jgi:glycerophosphodiester phosphodiesterase
LEAVVYHDFSLSESGTDIPIHDVTLAQYKHASDIHRPQIASGNGNKSIGSHRKRRAWSSGEQSAFETSQLRKRLQYTVDYQAKGFKPNIRGDVISDSLTTLEELLAKLPLDIGFNIEISTWKA